MFKMLQQLMTMVCNYWPSAKPIYVPADLLLVCCLWCLHQCSCTSSHLLSPISKYIATLFNSVSKLSTDGKGSKCL